VKKVKYNLPDDYFDNVIRQWVKNEVEKPPRLSQSLDEAWEKVQQKIEIDKRKTRKSRLYRKPAFLTSAAVLLILAATMLLPHTGSAFGRLTTFFYQVTDNLIQVFSGATNPGAQVKNPPNNHVIIKSGAVEKQMDLKEAQEASAFEIILPGYVPSDFHLENVSVMKEEGKQSQEITLNYHNQIGEMLTISEKLLSEQTAYGITVDKDDNDIKYMTVNENKAALITNHKMGIKQLLWETSNKRMTILGKVTEEEMLKIANSM
jgi:hypothetical protein